jgi:DNA invertase Pin-like site-specific DNA recombinase
MYKMLNIFQQTSKKAIAYYRHSAEDKQENSVAIQRGHVHRFAQEHQLEIIHEEADEGISGLLADRPGFGRIFTDWIENPQAPSFQYILVYDVSRWGRFQDQDQAAHYVYLCKKHHKEVVYVSKGFPDASNPLFSSLEISIQRYMAAEYSRQLSEKVFHGCVKVSQQGYSAGGKAVYGLARQLLNAHKQPVRILEKGEHKQIANERVTFTPKNDRTTWVVRKVFEWFAVEQRSISEIAEYLNKKEIVSPSGKKWDKRKILKILREEAYIGTRIYNRTRARLKQKLYRNARTEWVIVHDAFDPIISKDVFKRAQERLYWLFPSNWRQGVHAMNCSRKKIHKDLLNWLLQKGATPFEADEVLAAIPILFSVKADIKAGSQWCFLIPERFRTFENVLGISVTEGSNGIPDEFFMLSTKDFTSTNFLMMIKNTSQYRHSTVERDKVEEIIIILLWELKKSKPWNKNRYQFVEGLS